MFQPMPKDARIYVAGHAGLVGSAVVRRLMESGFTNILTASRRELDLRDQGAVNIWFEKNRPDFVFLVAGTVGGILANSTRPAEFIYDNLMIHGTVVEASHRTSVTKLLYLGSSCIYPRHATQPITEDQLLTGPLEPTNEWYAIAKIAGIKLCQAYRRQYGSDFISAMPTNLYGPNDNFDLASSHVLPALIRKFHEAMQAGRNEVVVWGSGRPIREFTFARDAAKIILWLAENYDGEEPVNIGNPDCVSIEQLSLLIGEEIGFEGHIKFDVSKPDGQYEKPTSNQRLISLGWKGEYTPLRIGLRETINYFKEEYPKLRGVI